jgi:PAS domain S-box-containing protein
MKTQSRILLSAVSSVAGSIVIAFIAFSILRGANTEFARGKACREVINKTHILNILTVSFKEGGGRSDIPQIKEVLLALDTLLKKMDAREPREQALIKQLQENHQELGPLIDRMLVSEVVVNGIEKDRHNILASQVRIKAQFISDNTDELMNISRSRIIAAQKKAGAMVIILIIILALTNGSIYLLSGRGIVRAQEALRESEERLRLAQSSAHIGIWEWQVRSGKLSWTAELEKLYGYAEGTFPGTCEAFRERVHPDDLAEVEGLREEAVNGHKPFDFDFRVRHPSGVTRWVNCKGAAVFDETGNPQRVFGVNMDITDRRQAEETLRASEEKYRMLFESIEEGFCIIEVLLDQNEEPFDYRFLEINPAFERHTGIKNAVGRRMREIAPQHEEHWFDIYGKIALTGQSMRFENPAEQLGRFYEVYAFRVGEAAERKVAILFKDITKRKRTELELRQSEERFSKAFYASPTAMSIMENDTGRHVEVNDAWLNTCGFQRDEVIGRTVAELMLMPPAEHQQQEVLRGDRLREILVVRKDGKKVVFLARAIPIELGGRQYILSTGLDITERRRAEEELKASEERYRHLLKYAPTGIYEVDFVNKRLKSVNEVMCRALGYTEEELLRMNPFDLLDEDGKKVFAERIRKRLMGEKVDETVEYQVIAKNGRKFWTVLNVAFNCEEGRTIGALVVAHDVTERKKAEETLRNNEAQLAKVNQIMSGILEHTHMLAVLLDSQFNFVWVNRAYAAASRHDPSFFPGKNHFDLYPQEDNKWIFQRVVDTGEPFFVAAKPFEYPDRPQLGVTYWDWSLVPVKDGSGGVSNLVFTLMEVTERIKAQEGLRKAHDELELRVKERTAELEHKNRELQEFAYVASHDLAEPLRKIQTFGDLLKARCADHLCEQERDYVSRMTGAAVRMQELLDALLRYSRVETQARDLVPVNLEDIVRTVTTDLEVSIKKTGVQVEIGPLPIINGDPYQWRQVFQNLIGNSAKYHRSEVKPFIKIYGEEIERAYNIFVEDNGIGFDEKYLDKIFEPFQRLHGKHEYPGTGIGLAICKKIVERHRGTITARSIPGKGSTFIVTLPVTPIKA